MFEGMCGVLLYVYRSHAYTCLEGEVAMRIHALKQRWRVPRYVWNHIICIVAMRIHALKQR